jgi:RHS repeat-associated protein
MRPGKVSLLAIVMLASLAAAQAQPDPSDPTFETGQKLFGSYDGGQIDANSLLQGGTTVDIPLISYPQRGGKLKLEFVLHFHEQGLYADNVCGPFSCSTVSSGYMHGFSVIETGAGVSGGTSGAIACPTLVSAKPAYGCNAYVYEADGSAHLMQPIGGTTWQAVDSSGYRLDTAPGSLPGSSWYYITGTDGTRYSFGGPNSTTSVVEDSNGNQIVISGAPGFQSNWTDTMARNVPGWPAAATAGFNAYALSGSAGDTSGCTGPLPIIFAFTWAPPGLNGGTYPLKFCYATVTEVFQFPNLASPPSSAAWDLQSVVLPDGSNWTFQYTNDGKNNLTGITFPTGGTLSYTWTSPPALSGTHQYIFTRGIASRTLNPNDGISPSGTWDYGYGVNGSTTVVTDPAGNDTTHTFTALGGFSFYETMTTSYKGSYSSGIPVKTVQTDYTFNTPPLCTSGFADVNVIPIRQTVTWSNGRQTKLERDYGSTFTFFPCSDFDNQGNMGPGSPSTGTYGRVTAVREFDYGSGAPGGLLRSTSTPHVAFSNSSYLNNNLLDLVSGKVIFDGSGNTFSSTTYGYDELSLTSSGVSTQHDSSPFTGSARGNHTSVARWLNTTGGQVTSNNQWFDTGELSQTTDAGDSSGNRHTTTYAYDSTGTYPTQICNALGQCMGRGYDASTGLVTSRKDANGNTSTYSYDSVLRLTQIQLPPDTSGNVAVTSFKYPNANTVQRFEGITAGLTDELDANFDGLGRRSTTVHVTAQRSTVATVYDSMGRVASVSNPYVPGVSTPGSVQFQYDPLGRVVQTTKQDGGITKAAYEQAAAVSSNTDCTLVTDEAGNPRQTCDDGLGRMVEVDEAAAGSGGAGTAATGSGTISGSEQSAQVLVTPAAAGTGSVQLSGAMQWKTVSSASTAGTTNITISGAEQQNPAGITPGTGSVTISGAEQTIAAVIATGSITVNGSLQSKQVQAQAATQASGYVTISGSEQHKTIIVPPPKCPKPPEICDQTGGGSSIIYDAGTITITVNGHSDSYNYGQNDSASTIASGLANAINGDGGAAVTASASGATLYLTSKSTGTAANVSLSSSYSYDTTDFSSPSFTTANSGGSLTGGQNATYNTIYDSGGCTLTVNGHGDSNSWSGSGTTAASIASALASAINGDGSAAVSASASNNVVNLTAKSAGTVGDYSLASSCSYDSSNFGGPSFTTASSGSSLSAGKNQVFDAGTVSITVNGHTNSVPFNGTSTPANIATALAANINGDTGASVTATASNATVTVTALTKGTISNYAMSVPTTTYDSTDFSKSSFSTAPSGATLTGGTPNNNAVDSGTMTVTVNSTPYTVSWGSSSTPGAIATQLATALGIDTTVTPTLSGATVLLNPKSAGTLYSFSTAYTYDSADFGHSSFANVNSISDYGTTTITVNGHNDSVLWSSAATPGTIASALASRINGDSGAAVNATVSGNAVSVTARTTGTATNYTLGSSTTYDTAHFSAASFNSSNSGTALAGGVNAVFQTVQDAGTVSVTVGGFTATATYQQGSTPSSVAAVLAQGLNTPSSSVSASVSGSGVLIAAMDPGTAGDYSLSGTASSNNPSLFPQPSFAVSLSGTALSGGTNPTPATLSSPMTTLYSYDALGNLTCVEQHGNASGTGCSSASSSDVTSAWRVRRFSYDSLSRLLAASNPESGAISYNYDPDGNMVRKISPAPNQQSTATQTISYCYDPLYRLTGKAYSAQTCTNGQLPAGTAAVTYGYDAGTNGIGHLTSLTDQAGSGSYNYDALGRISSEQRTIAGITKALSYTYNLDNSVASLTYPSGAVVTYTPIAAGQMLSAIDTGNRISYVTGATYAPDNQLTGFVNGNTITNSFSYNTRLQPVQMTAVSSSQTVFSLEYNFHLGAGDNGNVWGIVNDRDSTRSQSFTYDALNRLTSAQNAGTDCTQSTANGKTKYWGNAYGYDAWGNLTNKTISKCGAENMPRTADAQNRLHVITGADYQYDAAGNMTYDASGLSYSYNQENRITGAGGYTYTYDGAGNRVVKSNGTTGTLYWYMTPGIVAESDLSGNLTSEYVFFDGERVARKDFPGLAVSYYFSDNLKTTDIVTDAQGNIKNESDFYPWGGELQFTNGDSNHYKFTGKERDAETGLDYFGARYYSNGMGRFITPDWSSTPVPVPYADMGDPQTLNQYSYVRNLPLSSLDDDGHAKVEIRYTYIGPGYTHSYIVVTDTNGARTYFRAGPSAGGPSSGSSGALSSASGGSSSQSSGSGSSGSNSSNSSSPGSGPGGADANTGPFGALHADSGSYVPGTIDYETNPAASTTLLSNDLPAAGYINTLQQFSDSVNQANIPYNPLSTNSNAYATGAAGSLGLVVPDPPVAAPGSRTQLPGQPPLPTPPPPPPPPPPDCYYGGQCP